MGEDMILTVYKDTPLDQAQPTRYKMFLRFRGEDLGYNLKKGINPRGLFAVDAMDEHRWTVPFQADTSYEFFGPLWPLHLVATEEESRREKELSKGISQRRMIAYPESLQATHELRAIEKAKKVRARKKQGSFLLVMHSSLSAMVPPLYNPRHAHKRTIRY